MIYTIKTFKKKHIFGSPRCKSHFPAIFNGRFASQCGRLPPLRHGIHPPVMEIEGWFYGNLSNKHDKRGGLMGLSWEFKLMEYEWEIFFFSRDRKWFVSPRFVGLGHL
jgi:hypothetical protein